METLEVIVQTKEVFKNVNKSAMKYQVSREFAKEQYERLISMMLYQNPDSQDKLGESQSFCLKMSNLNNLVYLPIELKVNVVASTAFFHTK